MGLVNMFKDIVEDKIIDGVGKKVTGNYQHYRNCEKCGTQIDIKKGFDNAGALECPHCKKVFCWPCLEPHKRMTIIQHPAMFKKGRRQGRVKCPDCEQVMWESDVEEFR
jgi:ssDNA-binding Zn-finger/Zn-ribbon topoisomerase 1